MIQDESLQVGEVETIQAIVALAGVQRQQVTKTTKLRPELCIVIARDDCSDIGTEFPDIHPGFIRLHVYRDSVDLFEWQGLADPLREPSTERYKHWIQGNLP